MIDTFSLGLAHVLMMLLCWRLLFRPDLEDDAARPTPPDPAPARPLDRILRWGRRPGA